MMSFERSAFWCGFNKCADTSAGDGGKGFVGTGEGAVNDQRQQNESMVTVDTDVSDGKMLLDKDRNPKSFSPFEIGVDMESEDGSHVLY